MANNKKLENYGYSKMDLHNGIIEYISKDELVTLSIDKNNKQLSMYCVCVGGNEAGVSLEIFEAMLQKGKEVLT